MTPGPGWTLRAQEPLHRHNDLRVGGLAGAWAQVETEEALLDLVAQARAADVKVRFVSGTDWVARDGDLDGVCVRLGALALALHLPADGGPACVGAEVPAALLAHRSAAAGLSGAEGLVTWGGTVRQAVEAGRLQPTLVRVLRGARVAEVTPERQAASQVPLAYHLALTADRPEVCRRRLEEARRRPDRHRCRPGQAVHEPTRGPHVAELLDRAHLPGVRLRAARLGLREPNTLLNLGGATWRDLALLLTMMRDRVEEGTGVVLEPIQKPIA